MFALYSRSLQAFRVPYHSSDLTSPHLSSSKRSDILLAGLLICEFGRVRACILLLYFASLNSFLSCFVLWIAFSLLSLLKPFLPLYPPPSVATTLLGFAPRTFLDCTCFVSLLVISSHLALWLVVSDIINRSTLESW